uniref:histidine kinase n=1 Tax=candidate division WOR-3 bacterium TaxID=2052148 RepID=A0A7V3RHE8_UNCW3
MRARYYLPASIVLLILLGLFLTFGIISNQKAMLSFFKEEAHSILSIIALSQENSIFAEAEIEEKIVDNLVSIISYLNDTGYRKEILNSILQNFNLSSIVVYDLNNKTIIAKSGNPYEIDYENFAGAEKIKYYYFTVLNERYIRFLYRGGQFAFQIELSAEEIKRFSKTYGIGNILNQLVSNPLVNYVVLQDLRGIIFATPNIKSMSKIQDDSLLLKALQRGEEVSRISNFGNKKILEMAMPFVVENDTIGLFRIGMNLDNYYRHLRNTYIQLVLMFIILLIGGISILAIIIKHQNFQMQEQFFSHILGAIEEGVLLVDQRMMIRGINNMFSRITEIKGAPVLNKRYEEVFSGDPFLINLVHQTKNPVEEEKIIFKKIIRYTTYPLFTPDKKFMGTITILHDMTKIREQEKEEEEKERLSFLGNLVANFAHEIKNPLNGLAIAAQRLKREFPAENEQYNQLLSMIIKEIDSMTKILNDFLTLARPRIKEKREFNMSELIKEIGDLIRHQAMEKNIRYIERVDDGVSIKGSPEDIKRAIMNLLLNAIEAVSSESITQPQVFVALEKRKKNIIVKISDNGPGIPKQLLKKVFEPYFTTKKSGTGLGLFIAHKIIQEHNGRISIKSQEGKGTAFTIILPKNGQEE